MRLIARYVAYLAFAVLAPVFWLAFAYFGFGFLPFPGDPPCHFEPAGCPERSLVVQALVSICILGALPLTVGAFVFYRKFIRRMLGYQDRMWRDQ